MASYQIPDYLFQQVIKVAIGVPDPMRSDAMGRSHDELLKAWVENLRLYLGQVANEAFIAGAQWSMERNQRPQYLVVTREQYERIKEMGYGNNADGAT